MNIQDLVNYFTIAGAFAAIVATIMAFIAFINWKEQQEYSLKLHTLFDLEDNFIIYITMSLEDFKTFWQVSKFIRDNKDKSNKIVTDSIKGYFNERLDNKASQKARVDIEMAFIRVSRMNSEIKTKHHPIIERIAELRNKYISKADEESSLENYVKEIGEIRDDFIYALTEYRSKMKKTSLKKTMLLFTLLMTIAITLPSLIFIFFQ